MENLASETKYASVKMELAKWFPKVDAPDAPTERWAGQGEKDNE